VNPSSETGQSGGSPVRGYRFAPMATEVKVTENMYHVPAFSPGTLRIRLKECKLPWERCMNPSS